jgi:hypothetical protein
MCAAVLAAVGCSRSGDELPREPVAGTVTLDGVPLPEGSIQFTPTGKPSGPAVAGGATIQAGRFSIAREDGLVAGEYKVAISSAAPKEQAPTKGLIRKGTMLATERIPAPYNAKSTLTAEVKKGGSLDLKFDLDSKAK